MICYDQFCDNLWDYARDNLESSPTDEDLRNTEFNYADYWHLFKEDKMQLIDIQLKFWRAVYLHSTIGERS